MRDDDRAGRWELVVAEHRIAGRFSTRQRAEKEDAMLSRLAARNGDPYTSRIQWVPPMPDSEEEAAQFAFHERLP